MPIISSSTPVLDVAGLALAGAVVRAYRRDTGAFLVEGATGVDGNYSLTTAYTGTVNVVCLDPSENYADKILRTTPV